MVAVALASTAALLASAGGCITAGSHKAHSAATSSTPYGDPNALLAQGIQQSNARNFDAAKVSFQRVIAVDKKNKFAWYNLGVIAQTASQNDEAIKDYDSALATDPNFTSAMYNKAILLEASNIDGAIDLYRRILTINKAASSTYLRLGLLLDGKGDHNGARDNFRQAVMLDSTLLTTVPKAYQAQMAGS